ncbi:Asp-tRNA(Asn)/Glu-tRNA(Gln) amidotransferase subunit GatB [Brevibacterium daeguense]|uniref:Aspartyl/glutamyl-tRNA(Asn/Gln) amidotransferase subunit B n=1 Tax=Brevibacterium daeguense TaxID=909936 RepID=A0ABP8ELP3_9MICO|nr:Asp-tRNA(Asn)/Glu-tRNA(Gln) amidotransferase subunit GatB [Brevibacterium daeguense]
MKYEDAVAKYDPVIGIEVHVELGTATKMFDAAPNSFGGGANTNVTPVSLGLPGALPSVNRTAVEYAVKIGLALGCEIAESCRFARKNYFYPDVPKNFQTSQYDEPIAFDGSVDVELDDGEIITVPIERAHMEEDAGKNTHVGGSSGRIHGAEYSLVDYNRAGVPLVEIVTRPITGTGAGAPEVASSYVRTLRDIFRALGVSEARMEQGNVRADINVSLRPSPDAPLGTRTETKNVNSFRSIERAVRFEIVRQAELLDAGETVVQETRHFHEDTGETSPGRVKSDADDYRYFPEPDLVPLVPPRDWIEELRSGLPELPAERRRRLLGEWGFSELEMRDIINAGLLDAIEQTVSAGASPAAARKWWTGEISRLAKQDDREPAELATPVQVAELAELIEAGKLNDKLARKVLAGVIAGEGSPRDVMAGRGLEIVEDTGALQEAVEQAIADNPDVVEKIRGGKMQAIGALMGPIMKATRGQADAGKAREMIIERINA